MLDLQRIVMSLMYDETSPVSPPPANLWQKLPQCLGCGIVYQWLKKTLCAHCELRSETGSSLIIVLL
jgi:hypothetical protein